jgi:Tfp pilus assembly protein PilF
MDKTKDAKWAATAWREWWGEGKPLPAVEAMAAGRARSVGAVDKLKAVLNDSQHKGILRGSVASLISRQSGATAADLQPAAGDPDPLVRLGVAERLGDLAGDQQLLLAPALLHDPVRSVRIAAVRQLGANARQLPESEQAHWKTVWAEAVAAATFNADQAEALLDLGNLRLAAGDPNGADNAWHEALKREPTYQPARMNLADLARQRGDEGTAQTLLRNVIKQEPQNAAAHHALGLSLVRSKQHQAALSELAEAVRLDPTDARYALVLAVATHDLGNPPEAIRQLHTALMQHPTDIDLLSTQINFLREARRPTEALPLARTLAKLLPNDQSVQMMVKDLESGGPPQ